MLKVEISDEAYSQALKAAEARGLSLDAYLESLISRAAEVEEDFDSVFVHGTYAYVDDANERIGLDQYRTAEEVQAELEANQRAWRQHTAR